jgi:hypothetical protein
MNDHEINSITHCILFIGIMKPSIPRSLADDTAKFTILINSLAKTVKQVIAEHGGKIAKMADEGFECHFMQTNDQRNVRAIEDVLE